MLRILLSPFLHANSWELVQFRCFVFYKVLCNHVKIRFSGTSNKFFTFSNKSRTFIVSIELHIPATGHLNYLSIEIKIYVSMAFFFKIYSPRRMTCNFCPGSDNQVRFFLRLTVFIIPTSYRSPFRPCL